MQGLRFCLRKEILICEVLLRVRDGIVVGMGFHLLGLPVSTLLYTNMKIPSRIKISYLSEPGL